MRRTAYALAFAFLVAVPASARRIVPPTVELDGCVLPSTACDPRADVVEMTIDDEKKKFAVEELRVITATASSSKVLDELRLRGLRIHGPAELTRKLEPGPRRRVRGALRLGASYLLLQSVEPLEGRRQ